MIFFNHYNLNEIVKLFNAYIHLTSRMLHDYKMFHVQNSTSHMLWENMTIGKFKTTKKDVRVFDHNSLSTSNAVAFLRMRCSLKTDSNCRVKHLLIRSYSYHHIAKVLRTSRWFLRAKRSIVYNTRHKHQYGSHANFTSTFACKLNVIYQYKFIVFMP